MKFKIIFLLTVLFIPLINISAEENKAVNGVSAFSSKSDTYFSKNTYSTNIKNQQFNHKKSNKPADSVSSSASENKKEINDEFKDIIDKLKKIHDKKNNDANDSKVAYLGTKGSENSKQNFDLLLIWK
ncbi:hypothetical protein KA977_00090 [Candidatus Dependentiae bacterium]|nr:hypothetical protein [Candidatus Dependentiae bacterium]